jgi:hypothetical protein
MQKQNLPVCEHASLRVNPTAGFWIYYTKGKE